MDKYFLLIAGVDYYPGSATTDWVGTYTTRREAHDEVQEVNEWDCKYRIKGHKCDWYEVIDLRDWIAGKNDGGRWTLYTTLDPE